MDDQQEDSDDEKDDKQQLGNAKGKVGDAPSAEQQRYESNDGEDNGPFE